MEMSGEVGLPSCTGIAGNLVGSSLSISTLLLRLSVLGLMSNLPALLFATFIAPNPLPTNSFYNTIFVSSYMYPENPEGTQVIIIIIHRFVRANVQ